MPSDRWLAALAAAILVVAAVAGMFGGDGDASFTLDGAKEFLAALEGR